MPVLILMSRIGFYLSIVAISYLSVATLEQPAISTGWDKANHFIAFFVLLALFDYAHATLSLWKYQLPLLTAYGLLIEIVQLYLPYRMFSFADVAADVLGLICYVVLRRPIRFAVSYLDNKVIVRHRE